jgi:hypothetical protein
MLLCFSPSSISAREINTREEQLSMGKHYSTEYGFLTRPIDSSKIPYKQYVVVSAQFSSVH